MAILKMPLLSEKACGKFGKNIVFKRSAGRVIASIRPSPKRTFRSERQRQVCSILAELSRLQTTLSFNQLEDWKRMESYKVSTLFGVPKPKSVINSFVQINFFRRDRGLAALLDAPTSTIKGSVSELCVAIKPNEPGSVTLSWILPTGAAVQDAVDIWVSIPFNTITRKAQTCEFHHLFYIPGNSTSIDITGLETGKYYHFKARFVEEDGRVSFFDHTPGIKAEEYGL